MDYRFACGCQIYNTLVKHCRKQLTKLESDSLYKELLSVHKQSDLSKSDIFELNKQLADVRMSYGLSEYQFHDYVKLQQYRYKKHIDSLTAQKIATHVWQAVEKYLFADGKAIHFCKCMDFHSLEGKNNASGIRFKDGRLHWNGLVIQPKYNRSDVYAMEALECPVKYCRIKRMVVGTHYHYYLQLVLTGIPPQKHVYSLGDVGIDIGPSSVAVCADDFCALENLADSIRGIESEKQHLARKLDRSRKATSPGNYNPDGTVKKKPSKWSYSNTYNKTRMQYINACRKRTASLKQRQEILANTVLSHGSKVYIETMSFKGLQRRSLKTERNSGGKFKRKKRFANP